MKKLFMKKIIISVLVITMTVLLAACNKKAATTNTENTDTTEATDEGQSTPTAALEESPFAKYIEGEEVVDLQGYQFKVVDFHQDRWAPEEIKSPMDELVVSITEDVEKTFNCDIVFEAVTPEVIFETAQPEIMAGGKYADLIGTTMWAFGKLMGGNLLTDVNSMDSMDLSQPYFNQNVLDTATFGDKTYAFGAPFGSHIGNYWLVFYNTRIWEELGYEDPNELVRKGEWTWDKFVEYAKGALRDNDGDGIISTDADRWGLTSPSGDLIHAQFMGMGGKYYSENEEEKVRLACLDPVSAEKINYMYKFFQKDNILFKNENIGYLEMFAGGNALFMLYGNDTNDIIKNMEDDFGILPTPKWSVEQEEYINAVDHNAPIFAVTNTNTNLYETGIIIEALAKRYQAVEDQKMQDFVDTFWRLEEDEEMMTDYIIDHGAYDVINIIKNANSNFSIPAGVLFDGCYRNSYSDIVSTIASMEEPLNILLDEYFDNLSND